MHKYPFWKNRVVENNPPFHNKPQHHHNATFTAYKAKQPCLHLKALFCLWGLVISPSERRERLRNKHRNKSTYVHFFNTLNTSIDLRFNHPLFYWYLNSSFHEIFSQTSLSLPPSRSLCPVSFFWLNCSQFCIVTAVLYSYRLVISGWRPPGLFQIYLSVQVS